MKREGVTCRNDNRNEKLYNMLRDNEKIRTEESKIEGAPSLNIASKVNIVPR